MRSRNKKMFFQRLITAGLALFLAAGTELPVFADEDSSEHTITFQLENKDGTDSSREFAIDTGETYGDSVSDTVSVRDTYYDRDTGRDYDLDESKDNPELSGTMGDTDLTFYYTEHTDSVLYTVYCVDENGVCIGRKTAELSTEKGSSVSISLDDITAGGKTYRPSKKTVEVSYTEDMSLSEEVAYTTEDTDSDSYSVEVRYVDENDRLIEKRSFLVNGRPVTFYAPTTFSVNENGTTVYYTAADENETVIRHQVKDTARSYTVHYENAAEKGESYTWYIMQYDSSNNECLGVIRKTVKSGSTVAFDPESENTIAKYTVNKAFAHEITHTYGDSERTTYVYYDPEGYTNTTDLPDRTVTIRYVNIADGSLIDTRTVNAVSAHDTRIEFPDVFTKDGIHWLRVNGQSSYIDYSYYSPRSSFTIYYRDENNTEFANITIHNTELIETIVDGGEHVTYTVIPGITRVTAVDENGNAETVGVQDAAGNDVETDGTENDEADSDTVMDGVPVQNIDTPKGNIKLKDDDSSSSFIAAHPAAFGGILAGLAVLCVVIVILLKKRRGAEDEK